MRAERVPGVTRHHEVLRGTPCGPLRMLGQLEVLHTCAEAHVLRAERNT